MYQLQEETGSPNIQISVSGGKTLKHILVYSCAGGWISYTAGSMLFFCHKLQSKKSATMVQTILYVWLVLSFCVMKTIYRVQISVRKVSKKKKKKKRGTTETNTNIKHQLISLRKLVKAAFFLKSQGMAKPDVLLSLPWQHCRADHSGQVGNCRERQRHVTHHGQLYWKTKNKNIGSLVLFRRGPGVGMRIYFLAKWSLYQTFHRSAMTPVFSTCFEDMSPSRTGREITATIW